jgi:hypothetical protein
LFKFPASKIFRATLSSRPRVVPPLERRYSNIQSGKHRSLDLRVREGLNHA